MRTFENLGFWMAISDPEELQKQLQPLGSRDNLEYWFMWRTENLDDIIAADNSVLQTLWLTHADYAQKVRDIFLRIDEWHEDVNGMWAQPIEYIHSPECPWGDFCSKSIFDYSLAITEIILIDPTKQKEYLQLLSEKPIDPPNILQRLWHKKRIVSRPTFYMELVRKDIGLVLSDLQPHIIQDHNFFQGHESPYRIDPVRSRRFLWL